MNGVNKAIWITWEVQRRNRELSKALGAKLFEFAELHSRYGVKKYKKYFIGPFKTLKVLFKEKPDIVFCQNPSIVLSMLMVIVGLLTKIKVVVDAHYGGVIPSRGKHWFLNVAAYLIHRYADMVIVTNEEHKSIIDARGGTGYILQDKLPAIRDDRKETTNIFNQHQHNLLFVCSFGKDEPYQELVDAARSVPDVGIYITGRYQGHINPTECTPNVHLLGFINDSDFEQALREVNGIIVLTKWENCLVCGAYEAVAVGTPLLLSNTKALRSYFSTKGVVYANNDQPGLILGLQMLTQYNDILRAEIKELKPRLESDWEQRRQQLLAALQA